MHGNKKWPKRKCRNKLKIIKLIKGKLIQNKIKKIRKRRTNPSRINLKKRKKHNSPNKKRKNPPLQH